MNISRFVGATSREVMRQVRMALGPDALIVSNRRVNGGVEVMATDATAAPGVDAEAAVASLNAAPPASAAGVAPRPADPQPRESAPAPRREPDVLGAINALRGSLETRIEGLAWGSNLSRVPMAATLYRQLLGAGFSTALVRAMLQRLPEGLDYDGALGWVRNELVTHLPMLRHEDHLLGRGGVFALVGPTGVGKTTTLAKLAARCVQREGPNRVLMVTTDSYRIGAHEQLQIYGRLMGVPVLAVQDGDGLKQALAQAGERHIVLIDNVGISQRDRQVGIQAAMLCGAGKPVRKLLVLNASSQGDTLDEVAHAYRHGADDDVAGCIITKLDEATNIGAVLDTAIRHRLPIHYVSHGQKVPEHLTLPRASDLVDQALAGMDQARALYAPSEADLAALWSGTRPGSGGSRDEAASQARSRQLLLSAINHARRQGSAPLSAADMGEALAWLGSDPACARARVAWQRQSQSDSPPAAAELLSAQLSLLEKAYASYSRRYLLALHVSLKLPVQAGSASLGTSLVFGDRGAALVSPLQQLTLEHGKVANWSADGANEAESRVRWFDTHLPQLPTVHCFDNDAVLGPTLSGSDDVLWLARCPATKRLIHDQTVMTAQAIGKASNAVPVSLAAEPVADGQRGSDALPTSTLWITETAVGLGARRLPGRTFRLVSVRQVDDATGKLLAHHYGLSNLDPDEADTATLARWLVLQDQARGSLKLAAAAWSALDGAQRPASEWLPWTTVASQLAVAAWQVRHAPAASGVRRVLQQMGEGASAITSDRKLVSSVLRLYALMEMSPTAQAAS